ncbi:adenylyltransferase/cytidyltransferase family protein, partial [bacterium]|nr:adenylyltransferase/cytidyltransferase family protein [bacterium]
IVGTGHAGNQVLNIFEQTGISTQGIVVSESFQTIVKQRAITSQQQLLRIDYESPLHSPDDLQSQLLERVMRLLPEMDAVILSDYNKGVLNRNLITKTIEESKKLNLPVICDPGKGVDFSWYKGVTAIKPNRTETEQATGITLKDHNSILKAAKILKSKCDADFLAISLDKDGILHFVNEKNYLFIETQLPEVYDVTGAGDMVISIIGVLLASKISPELSSRMANIAAGLETSHLGVVPIQWSEIRKHLSADGLNKKIMTIEELEKELRKKNDAPLIFTNGYFDNISAGHLRFLFEISKIPGKLIVAINSDKSITKQKGTAPLLKENDRLRLLASIENVHYVVVFEEENASNLIRRLSPDVVVKGDKFKDKTISENEAIIEVGARVEYIQHFSWQ